MIPLLNDRSGNRVQEILQGKPFHLENARPPDALPLSLTGVVKSVSFPAVP